jgi:hypothetical protein
MLPLVKPSRWLQPGVQACTTRQWHSQHNRLCSNPACRHIMIAKKSLMCPVINRVQGTRYVDLDCFLPRAASTLSPPRASLLACGAAG